jgi:hypothetical protein
MIPRYSGSLLDGYLLEEMRNGIDSEWEVGEGRRELHGKLCGSVYGCEFYSH